ncbi:rho GTPase-activating protein 15 isoform X3 [Papio anubis]|uniref:Rho GTPase-activating protein 15 n=1 Tax=Cercocebus atys TaxID=9531 RepID=A0A2K5MLA2_CERAT|nr:PREDICTED: rho GTPase-activating protein 15 isoform X2 [Cercocebus atys]XP_031507626.1 rho GTPase-activating protein 15 isoform X3 [Papio anubis]
MQKSTNSDTSLETLNSTRQGTGAVQMRIKNANSHHDRLSQSKSMILTDVGKVTEPISRHRRNHSQHILKDVIPPLEQLMVEKEGYLQKAKIADGGKKLRKNWSTSWIVLSSRKIEFYKESKQQALSNMKTGHKPESVDLCGAHIEWAKEKSSRKNVFQITTVSGNEFLLQSDIDFIILDWFHAIKNAIDRLPKDSSCPSRNLELFKIQRSSSTELLSHYDSDIKEQKPEHRKSLMFRLHHSASDTSDKNRVKSRLKKFITRRPSLKTLQEKGLIKGLDVDGIYRVSGNLATIQKLRFIVNQEEKLNLDDSQWEDIHVVTGALKMFFRELPEPLFPYSFFERFVEAIKKQDNNTRIEAVKCLVQKLPPPNRDTMKVLFGHLTKIVAKASKNLMSTQSLGIVFGPTLLRAENETGNMAIHMVYQNQIAELMLSEYSKIFSSEED